jgi:hypothetical protein
MLCLSEIPIDILKQIPSSLWAKPLDAAERQLYEFIVVGTMKFIHAEKVCVSFMLLFFGIKKKNL